MHENVVGAILAGGLSRRMGGGDKAFLRLGGATLIEHIMRRLQTQVMELVVSANGDLSRFDFLGVPVIADAITGHAGPLAGIAAVMAWTRTHRPEARYIATAACDTPFFPADLVKALGEAADERNGAIGLAASNGKLHPVFGLWPVSLSGALEEALRTGTRKVTSWAEQCGYATADFGNLHADGLTIDPFFNINTPEDLAQAERFLTAAGGLNKVEQ